MSHFNYLDKESGSGGYIVPENFTKQVKIHKRLRKQNAAIIRDAEAWRKHFRLDNPPPPLLITMRENAEGIPAGIIIEALPELSLALIRLRAATPVGDFNVVPDAVIEQDEL